MTARLPPCDTWHPYTESRITRHKGGRSRQLRTVCLECNRAKTAKTREVISHGAPYGVIRLSWTPPKMIPRGTSAQVKSNKLGVNT